MGNRYHLNIHYSQLFTIIVVNIINYPCVPAVVGPVINIIKYHQISLNINIITLW